MQNFLKQIFCAITFALYLQACSVIVFFLQGGAQIFTQTFAFSIILMPAGALAGFFALSPFISNNETDKSRVGMAIVGGVVAGISLLPFGALVYYLVSANSSLQLTADLFGTLLISWIVTSFIAILLGVVGAILTQLIWWKIAMAAFKKKRAERLKTPPQAEPAHPSGTDA